MNLRFVLIVAAAVANGPAFAAEPPKAPVEQAAQPQRANPPVVLASADTIRASAAADRQSATPVKHRVARVTTCRCGDQPAADPEGRPEQ